MHSKYVYRPIPNASPATKIRLREHFAAEILPAKISRSTVVLTLIENNTRRYFYLWNVKARSLVCNSMRKIKEIIKDYGGVANGCQLKEVWPGGQKTSNEG